MAQRIIGLDIGSWSIKAMVLESSLRRMSFMEMREHHLPVDAHGMPLPGELPAAIRAVLKGIDVDVLAAGVPGVQVPLALQLLTWTVLCQTWREVVVCWLVLCSTWRVARSCCVVVCLTWAVIRLFWKVPCVFPLVLIRRCVVVWRTCAMDCLVWVVPRRN